MKKCPLFTSIAIILFSLSNIYGQENLTFTVNGVSFNMIYVEGGTFVMGCTAEQGSCFPEERPAHTVTLTDFFMGEFEVTQKLWKAIMGTNLRHLWLSYATENREYWAKVTEITKRIAPDVYIHFGPTTNTFDVTRRNNWVEDWTVPLFAEQFTKAIPLNGEGEYYPVYFISYNECELFCTRLNELLADQLPEGYKFKIPTEAQWEYAARGGKMSQGYQFCGSDIVGEVAWYDVNSEKTAHEV